MLLGFRGSAILFAGTFVLTACGNADKTGALPQNMVSQSRSHKMSGLSGDLLYVGAGGKRMFVLSYPEGEFVGSFSLSSRPWGLCSDTEGNVFVTEDSGAVVEYAHGGSSPINTLTARGAYSCSWDPSTGDLAVVVFNSIIIFSGSSFERTRTYTDASFSKLTYCAYGDKGRLFATGELDDMAALTELDTSSGTFRTIGLNERVESLDDLQWDGKYLAVDDFERTGRIYRVQVSGSTGTIEATTSLRQGHFFSFWTWLQNGTFISPIYTGRYVNLLDFWSYPSGGRPTEKLRHTGISGRDIYGVTISVAPSRSHIHK